MKSKSTSTATPILHKLILMSALTRASPILIHHALTRTWTAMRLAIRTVTPRPMETQVGLKAHKSQDATMISIHLKGLGARGVVAFVIAIGFIAIKSSAQTDSQACLNRADKLSNAASQCRQKIASGELDSCVVTLAFRGGANVSIEEAEKLSSEFRSKASALKDAEDAIKTAKEKVAMDQRAIENLGLNRRAQDFDEWAKLSEVMQREYEIKTLSNLADAGLAGIKIGAKTIKSLNPPLANKYISQLKAKGVSDPYLFDAIRALANTTNKPATAVVVANYVKATEKAKKAAEIMASDSAPVTQQKGEDGLEAIATLLGATVQDPVLQLLVADFKFTASATYTAIGQNVIQANIEALDRLTEQQLQALKKLDELMKKHVQDLKGARARQDGLPKCQ